MPKPPTHSDPYLAAAEAIHQVMACEDDRALVILRALSDEDLMSVRASASILAGLSADLQEERRPTAVAA